MKVKIYNTVYHAHAKRSGTTKEQVVNFLLKHGKGDYGILSATLQISLPTIKEHVIQLKRDEIVEIDSSPGRKNIIRLKNEVATSG